MRNTQPPHSVGNLSEPAPQAGTPAELRASGIAHQYHRNWWCLNDINFALRAGELVGLVGPNGSGKSTLLNVLTGLIRPTKGAVLIDNRTASDMTRREVARRLAYLPQVLDPAFAFTVEEVVALGRYPYEGAFGILRDHDHAIIRQAMEWTSTLAFAARPVMELSGGERQRVFLASVLAQETPLLLLDEPTSALDLHHQVDVFVHLAALARAGRGVLVITHDLNLAAQFCTRIVLLAEGRVAADGSPDQVMQADILRKAYDADLTVDRNPVTGTPLVILRGSAVDLTLPGATDAH